MTRFAQALLLTSAACSDMSTVSGTAVGNPGSGLTVETTPAANVRTVEGALRGRVVGLGCDGVDTTLEGTTAGVDLTGSTQWDLPAGRWCGVAIRPEGTATYTGVLADERAYAVELALPDVVVRSAAGFDAGPDSPLVLRVGPEGWLNATALGPDDPIDVQPGSPQHAALLAAIDMRSVLFVDTNGDGLLSGDEAPVAAAPDGDGDDDDDTGELPP